MTETPDLAELEAAPTVPNSVTTLSATSNMISTQTTGALNTIAFPIVDTQPTTSAIVAAVRDSGVCTECSTPFKGTRRQSSNNLRRHIKAKHSPDARRVECVVKGCNKKYTRYDNMMFHVRHHHSDAFAHGLSLGAGDRILNTGAG